jgi:hypothetical protein
MKYHVTKKQRITSYVRGRYAFQSRILSSDVDGSRARDSECVVADRTDAGYSFRCVIHQAFEAGRAGIFDSSVSGTAARGECHFEIADRRSLPCVRLPDFRAKWIDSDRYDLEAKIGGDVPPSKTQLRSMLQRLLADRFGLSVRRESKEMSVYMLEADKGATKLQPAKHPDSP